MKILITGATGFIGNKLAQILAEHGHIIHALVRSVPPATQHHKNISYHPGDITDYASVLHATAGCEQVYHVAGYAKLWAEKRNTFYDINVAGTENVLRAAIESGVSKLIYTSSCAVFGPSLKNPICETDPRITAFSNDYDLSKFMAEVAVRNAVKRGLNAVIVNPSRVYGPGLNTHANMITKMVLRCKAGKWVLMPGIGNVIGNYAFIDDVVDGHISAMEKGRPGERYIVGGENLSYREVISAVRDEIRKPKLIPLPAAFVKLWGHVELMKHRITGKEPKFTPEAVGRYLQNAAFDCSKAKNEFDYQITSFRQGISAVIAHHDTGNKQLNFKPSSCTPSSQEQVRV